MEDFAESFTVCSFQYLALVLPIQIPPGNSLTVKDELIV
jgi:hypothetical protein